jgi:environmental stress-induced protein Ves
MARLTLLQPTDYQRTRWKNDGGWTTEIARSADGDGADFRWRISIAEIERDGPFSSFPGIARDLLLLEGNGIELDIDGAAPRSMTQRFERVQFDGESSVDCRLIAGPTRDFNVMARRAAVRAEVVARPLVGSMVIFPQADAEWFVHVFAGHADARSGEQTFSLESGASLLADFRDGGGSRIVLEGGGELVLVKFLALTDQDAADAR